MLQVMVPYKVLNLCFESNFHFVSSGNREWHDLGKKIADAFAFAVSVSMMRKWLVTD